MSDAGLAKETDMYFMGVVERGTGKYGSGSLNWRTFHQIIYKINKINPFSTARLNAAVVLSPRYPEVSPLFSLSLSWKGERTGQTDDNLRV